MAECITYNCDVLGDYDLTLENCVLTRAGGVNDIVLLLCGHTVTDPTDATSIQDNIDAGFAKRMSNFKLGINKATPVTTDSVIACGTSVTINNDFAGTIYDAKVNVTNQAFYNQLIAGYVIAGMIGRICDTDGQTGLQFFIDSQINFSGGLVIPDNSGEILRYEMDFTFRTQSYDLTAASSFFD